MRTYYSIGEMKIVHTAEAYDIERLRVEIARLREALEKIANEAWNTHAEFCHPLGCDSPGIARAALAEKENNS